MDLKTLMFLKKASGGGDQNLLDYSDLVNKTYGGTSSMNNVRPEHIIAVKPGASMLITMPKVTETDIRFYDENKTYQSSKNIEHYNLTEFTFTVPEGMYYLLPKWYSTSSELPVETFIQSNPSLKYV